MIGNTEACVGMNLDDSAYDVLRKASRQVRRQRPRTDRATVRGALDRRRHGRGRAG